MPLASKREGDATKVMKIINPFQIPVSDTLPTPFHFPFTLSVLLSSGLREMVKEIYFCSLKFPLHNKKQQKVLITLF